jgi:hypothetical protein
MHFLQVPDEFGSGLDLGPRSRGFALHNDGPQARGGETSIADSSFAPEAVVLRVRLGI